MATLALMALLSACAGTGLSDAPSGAVASAAVAPPVPRLKIYSKEFVDRLADELDATPADSPPRVCAADLYTLRRQICAINSQQPACKLIGQSK
ncbi:hypothetical protein [uncultured Cohaesibacter sp.]|uniref:hypothetical protein n=1 Tax=uncultured Cohaesibacter sp. TaxID=1002546 RepID=UPI0029C8AAE0|nr:hypothetical protein [uncultured Cohaesibacter sp.]